MNDLHDFQIASGHERRRISRETEPIIYDDGDSVTLQFLMGDIQSKMCVSEPNILLLTYTRVMAAFTLFHRKPKRIAIIGLGGGSLPKWCYHQLPHSDITVIELNPNVIALRDRFMVPPDDERFRVFCADGAAYVSINSESADVLLVDGFDIDGQPPQLCSQEFYNGCYRTLRDDGLLVVNLCDHRQQREMLTRIKRCFGDQVTVVTPEPDENTIAFATKGDRLQPSAVLSSEIFRSLPGSLRFHPELRLRTESHS